MTRGILIAGNESSLFSATAAEAGKRSVSFASAVIPNRFPVYEGTPAQADNHGISLSWNPSSPISAHTMILAAENRLEKINDAILVCSPPAVFKTAEALTPQEIDILANDHVKGWFFLVRELILYFRRAGSGTLSLVVQNLDSGSGAKNAPIDLLGPPATAAFTAFSQGILASPASEPFQAMGFISTEAGVETDFAAWFFKTIDESTNKNSGRWHKYSKIKFFR